MDCNLHLGHRLEAMPRRTPIDGTFELTVRCNLHCKMCLFRHADCENQRLKADEMTADEWIHMARQAAAAGTFSLLITGGEPMLRPDFSEIYEGIYRLGFMITLYTNGTLVTPKIMELLRKYPPHRIGVTLYGASGETYEKVCGSFDAYEKAIEGMRQLKTLPSALEFRTTVIRDNLADVADMEALIHREFGPQYRLTQTRMVNRAVRGGCADVDGCRLTPRENIDLYFRRTIDRLKAVVGDSFDESRVGLVRKEPEEVKLEASGKEKITLFGCDAGMSSYTITWDGQLLGCQLLGNFHTDARHEGLQKAWEEYPHVVEVPPMTQTCLSCDKSDLCTCCPAARYAETGQLNGVPEYVCQEAEIIQDMLDRNRKGGK